MPEEEVDLESLREEIEDWLKDDCDNSTLKTFLSLILIRYTDTKDKINYLKHHISEKKYLEYIKAIDDNVKVTHTLYELALMNLMSSYHKEFDKTKELVNKINSIVDNEKKQKNILSNWKWFNLKNKNKNTKNN